MYFILYNIVISELLKFRRPSLKHVSISPCTDCADDDGSPGWDDIPDGNPDNYYARSNLEMQWANQ